ncbi:MAG TPA: FecR family protein [Bacteroidales bacterium]|nr:FecR family protein [Bacteroidales bacterium]
MFEELHNRDKLSDGNDLEKKILSRTSQFEVPHKLSNEEAYAQLKARIEANRTVTMVPRSRTKLYWISSAAALALIIFGIGVVLLKASNVSVIAPKGEHVEYALPDSSIVIMNADSKLTFNKSKFRGNRVVKLEGEAFFKVKKGSRFTIQTRYADIRVLGTSFNIYSRDNSFKVSCVTGKVEVKNRHDAVVLAPGECAVESNKHLKEYLDKNIKGVTNWQVGEFSFEGAPLNLVFKEIERQFNVTFIIPDLSDKFYTGGFSNKNLVEALDVVCIPMELNYEIGTNSKIRISNKPD